MSVLETADTDVGPGAYEPYFESIERNSRKSTFGSESRFKKEKEEKENFVWYDPKVDLTKKSIPGVKIKNKSKKTK